MIVTVDADDVTRALNLTEERTLMLIDNVIKSLAIGLYDEWVSEAKKSLGSTRQEYINGLIIGDDGPLTSKVTLVGILPNELENGKSPFDMKDGFENSPKRKEKKDGGWYLTIPFRHATPGSVGESSLFSSVMPEDIFKQMAAVAKQTPSNQTPVLKNKDLPAEFQTKGVRKEIKVPETNEVFKAYKHKSAIYAGLTKITKQYDKASQSQYMTFRRVSDKSDPDSWIHPGFNALKLGEKALQGMDISSTIAKAKDEFIDNEL